MTISPEMTQVSKLLAELLKAFADSH